MMRKLTIFALVMALGILALTGVAYAGKPVPPSINLIEGRPAKGMYCADPVKWIQSGYKIYVWGNATPVRAQVYDFEGYLQIPGVTFRIPSTGETGSMTVLDSTNKVYAASPTSVKADGLFNDQNTTIEYTAGGVTKTGVIRRWNSDCDGCHTAPPAHALANAGSNGTSTCRNSACHAEFAWKMKVSHASRVPNNTSASACYSCHPSPCYSGVHQPFGIDCVSCHGSLADAASGAGMWVPGSKGLPRCENCHVTPPNTTVPYAQNAGKQYKESVGHGRANRGAKNLCITCHNSMHMEQNPIGLWGTTANNNCDKCHVNKPTNNNMGPVCGNCHVSSTSPHLAKK